MLFTLISVASARLTTSLPCDLVDGACSAIFTTLNAAIDSTDQCTVGDAVIETACELAQMGSEIAWGADCAATMESAFGTACEAAVTAAGSFTANDCITATGCSASANRLDKLESNVELGDYDGIACSVMDTVCDQIPTITGNWLTSQFECLAPSAAIAGACEVAGIGPEDPLSDVCAVTFAAVVETACTVAIDSVGSFGASTCKQAAGCSSAELGKAPALEDYNGIGCSVMDTVCDDVFSLTGEITSQLLCVAGDAAVAAACEAVGIGPEDPLSDVCAVTFAAVFETACTDAISSAGSFGSAQCKAAAGCSSSMKLAAPDAPTKVLRYLDFASL